MNQQLSDPQGKDGQNAPKQCTDGLRNHLQAGAILQCLMQNICTTHDICLKLKLKYAAEKRRVDACLKTWEDLGVVYVESYTKHHFYKGVYVAKYRLQTEVFGIESAAVPVGDEE